MASWKTEKTKQLLDFLRHIEISFGLTGIWIIALNLNRQDSKYSAETEPAYSSTKVLHNKKVSK